MNQTILENPCSLSKNTSSPTKAIQQRLSVKVFDILHSEFHHPIVPMGKSVLVRLPAPELDSLYSFLTNDNIEHENILLRPECPVKKPNQISLARYAYKKSMIEYISGFGYQFLSNNPCSYTPSFLETFANYCEAIVRNKED